MWLRILEPQLKDGRKPQLRGANGSQKHVSFLLFRDFSSYGDRGDILMKHYNSEWLFKFWLTPDQISWTFPFLTCQVTFMKQDSIKINLVFFYFLKHKHTHNSLACFNRHTDTESVGVLHSSVSWIPPGTLAAFSVSSCWNPHCMKRSW